MSLNIFSLLLLFFGTIQCIQSIELSSYADNQCTSVFGTVSLTNGKCYPDANKGTSSSFICQSNNIALGYDYSDLACKQLTNTTRLIGDGKTCNFVRTTQDPGDPFYVIVDCSDKSSTSSDGVPVVEATVHKPSNANTAKLNMMAYVIICLLFVLFANYV